MSNWWKRFFGLEDEDQINPKDETGRPGSVNSPRSIAKGRFEDPGRHIEVKMVNQYPINQSVSRKSPIKQPKPVSRPSNSENWDEPAFTRRHQPRRSPSRVSRSMDQGPKPFTEQKHRDYLKNETSETTKKKPFRPTRVPSPIYGYQERKVPQKDIVEPVIPQQKIYENAEDNMLQDLNQNIRLEENLEVQPYRLDETPIETDMSYSEVEVASTVEEITPVVIDRYQDDYDEWKSKPDLDLHTELDIEEESEGLYTDLDIEEESEDLYTEQDIDEESEIESTQPRSSVPYNVLMFGADRHAARQKQSVSPIVNPSPAVHSQHHSVQRQEWKSTEQHPAMPKSEKKPLPLELLQDPPRNLTDDLTWITEKKEILKQVLKNFHVHADIVSHVQGPTVTRFEIRLHPGVKVSKVIGLTEDIKLSMAAEQIRIAPVAGKNTVGIEIPNESRRPVFLKRLLQSERFIESTAPLTAALGLDISGQEVITDLSKMPHGLIAGATGSGKSVCIHSLILSLIYKSDPDALRLVLIDPKVVELAMYQRLPHLAAPVITQPKDAALALRWAVEEMERRYQAFADIGVRDIKKYNQTVNKEERWPYIVIIIDELADLMMVSPQDVEESICRIAQKARAAGIHLLLATQRPSVDVITGLIKANIPTRIAFGVSSQADSRTILDSGGAERLLGQGDMLFAENGSRDIQRLQGAFVSDEEIDRVTEYLLSWPSPPHLFDPVELRDQKQVMDGDDDELYYEAASFVIEQGQASVSSLQRRFRIGYNRAARLIDSLEAREVISEANGSKPRQVLMTKDMFVESE